MDRSLGSAALLATLAATLVAPGALAQDTSAGFDGHPFVGAWLVDTNTDDVTDPPSRLVVHPDGTLLQVDHATTAVGVWEPTGDDAAALTITAQVDVGDGHVATITVRGVVTLEPGGDTWTATATTEQVDATGSASGQMGPIPAAATRILVEPMGPAASPSF